MNATSSLKSQRRASLALFSKRWPQDLGGLLRAGASLKGFGRLRASFAPWLFVAPCVWVFCFFFLSARRPLGRDVTEHLLKNTRVAVSEGFFCVDRGCVCVCVCEEKKSENRLQCKTSSFVRCSLSLLHRFCVCPNALMCCFMFFC